MFETLMNFFTENITIIKDFIISFAAIVTASVAFFGLKSWKKEAKGKKEIEIAYDLLRSIYSLREQIKSFRSPLYSGWEFPEGYADNFLDSSCEETFSAYSHLYFNRWERIRVVLVEFESLALSGEAMWGEQSRQKTDSLLRLIDELYVNMEIFLRDKQSCGEDFKTNRDFGDNVKSVLTAHSTIENEMSNKIKESIDQLESFLKPHLS